MDRSQAIDFLLGNPVGFGHLLGFDLLTDIHQGWLTRMIQGEKDDTLQAHRGSYKTTCVSIALAILIILYPNKRIAFIRKTDDDVKEIIKQVRNILLSPVTAVLSRAIWEVDIFLIEDNSTALTTNLTADIKGTSQLTGFGTKSSVTGKHYDIIFTDDIVNKEDRASRAERDKTKAFYQELFNLRNRGGGRIFNSGTPWHPDDAFTIMPPATKYDCFQTGLMTAEQVEEARSRMSKSLFSANYLLKHVADEDVLFTEPIRGAEPSLVEQGICHIDAAYGGEDYTAFTIMRRADGKYYTFGKIWDKGISDVEDEIIRLRIAFNAGKISLETNGDKGFLAKEFKRKGERVNPYHEDMNKYIKISTYLKAIWKDVVFVAGTDEAYIDQICDYNETAEHDDAPDSCACLARLLWRKSANSDFKPSIYA